MGRGRVGAAAAATGPASAAPWRVPGGAASPSSCPRESLPSPVPAARRQRLLLLLRRRLSRLRLLLLRSPGAPSTPPLGGGGSPGHAPSTPPALGGHAPFPDFPPRLPPTPAKCAFPSAEFWCAWRARPRCGKAAFFFCLAGGGGALQLHPTRDRGNALPSAAMPRLRGGGSFSRARLTCSPRLRAWGRISPRPSEEGLDVGMRPRPSPCLSPARSCSPILCRPTKVIPLS